MCVAQLFHNSCSSFGPITFDSYATIDTKPIGHKLRLFSFARWFPLCNYLSCNVDEY